MKKFFAMSFLAVAILFNTAHAAQDRETLYQVALLQSLAMGYFDGNISVKDLKTHGDTGIGTFEGLNGEMIILDGVVYRADENCEIHVVKDRDKVSFSNVTFFDSDFSLRFINVADKAALEEILNKKVDKLGRNSFYMVKISGDFNEILIRSECAQSKPYPTLIEALKTQNEITPQNISGTIVGLYCPDFMSSLNAPGWHLHFISADKKIGGHVLDLNIKRGEAQFDKTNNFEMGLPTKKNFHELNFNQDLKEDIRKAEQDSVRR